MSLFVQIHLVQNFTKLLQKQTCFFLSLFFLKGKGFLVVFSISLKPMYIAINYLIFPLDNILKIQDGLIEWGDMKLLITDMAFHHNIVSSMTYLH